jgi:hypothetical protein
LDGLAFAPSRFIGYAGNSFTKHEANDARDGRQTNAALKAILGHEPVQDATLEQAYHRFCAVIGIKSLRTGTFGVVRKYWITPEIRNRLDLISEDEVMADPSLTQTEKEQIVKSRIGQGAFRDRLFAKWKRCCMTGCEIHPILRASHIKPWRQSNNDERLDVFNGLLLSPNMDALFDRGFISFSDDGKILHGPEIGIEDLVALGCKPELKIKFSPLHMPYLKHHRSEIFGPRTQNGAKAKRSVKS